MNAECSQFDELCRTCTKKSYDMQNLFDASQDGVTLAEKIYVCSQIQISQQIDRPSNMCCECVYKLDQAFEFYESVRNSERIFQKMLLIPVTNPNICTKERPIPAEMVEVKMELQHIEHDSTSSPIADADVIVDVKEEEEEQTEFDSLEMEPPNKKQRKQTTTTTPTKSKRTTTSVEKRGKEKHPNRSFECYRCKEKFLSGMLVHTVVSIQYVSLTFIYFSLEDVRSFETALRRGKVQMQCLWCAIYCVGRLQSAFMPRHKHSLFVLQ